MKQDGKKYILRESELKEIIKEMILMEIYEPEKYVANFKNGVPPEGGKIWKNGIGNAIHNAAQAKNGGTGNWLSFLDRSIQKLGNVGYLPGWGRDIFNSTRMRGGPGIGRGSNADATQEFFIGRAVSYLKHNAYPQYIKGKCGNCARFVREAMNAGGLSAPWEMFALSRKAKGYIQILPANGWYEIPESSAGQPGDVLVIDGQPGHPDGHIAMCIGPDSNGVIRWAADYVHGPGNVYGLNGQPAADTVYFFRYRNPAGNN